MSNFGYQDIIAKLKEIEVMGFVKTHRKGPTGIGKTLEDLLGIKENNFPGPDTKEMELKSARKNSTSMLTLMTKTPMPKDAIAYLLKRYGYPSSSGQTHLHYTLSAVNFTGPKGKNELKVVVDKEVKIMTNKGEIMGFWKPEVLREAFEKKYPNGGLLYVKADDKGRGVNEEFHFNEAYVLKGFNYTQFVEMIKTDSIKVDLRLGLYSDGRTHDHGTGFRIPLDKFELAFAERIEVMSQQEKLTK